MPEPRQALAIRPGTEVDADDALSGVSYDKGAWFLHFLEERYGRDVFDPFLRGYFDHFAFQSITTETFLAYAKEHLLGPNPGVVSEGELEEWLYGPGIPASAPQVLSPRLGIVDSARLGWRGSKQLPPAQITAKWSTQEWLHFLEGMPGTLPLADLEQLDAAYGFTGTANGEIAMRWYPLAIRSGYAAAYPAAAEFIARVGRRKLIIPVYTRWWPRRAWRWRETRRARPGYPITTASVGCEAEPTAAPPAARPRLRTTDPTPQGARPAPRRHWRASPAQPARSSSARVIAPVRRRRPGPAPAVRLQGPRGRGRSRRPRSRPPTNRPPPKPSRPSTLRLPTQLGAGQGRATSYRRAGPTPRRPRPAARYEKRAPGRGRARGRRLEGAWTYQTIAVKGGQQVSAAIHAKEPVDVDGSGPGPVQLIFRDHPEWGRSSYLVLEAGDFARACYRGCRVEVTVDDQAPRRMAANRPDTDEAIAMFIDDEKALWRLLRDARRLRIAFPTRDAGTQAVEFEVGGLDRSKMPRWD